MGMMLEVTTDMEMPWSVVPRIVHAGHCYNRMILAMISINNGFLFFYFTLDMKESQQPAQLVFVLCFTSGPVQECAELSLSKKTVS